MTVEGIKAKLDEAGWYEDYYYPPGSYPGHWVEYVWRKGDKEIILNYTTGQIRERQSPNNELKLDDLV